MSMNIALNHKISHFRSCPVNCHKEFYMFLAVMCILKFFGASSRSSNFLIGVRYVIEYDHCDY